MKKRKINLRDLKPNFGRQHSQNSGHNHSNPEKLGNFKTYLPAIFSFVTLIAGIAFDYFETFS